MSFRIYLLISVLFLFYCVQGVPTRTKFDATCGYESCPKVSTSKLNVHLVPHTHDDVGWLKTVDQYYYGSKTNIQSAGVQYIIDSVIEELKKDENRRFIYVETSFLHKWFNEQNEEIRNDIKNLLDAGRLEIIGGGWSMNDEATTHYQSIIDQMTWGFKVLNDTFGSCSRPRIGWQIDPFGHSRQQASLFAQMGFDGLLFARLDYQDKDNRVKNKNLETVWQTSPNLGDAANLFTSVLYYFYGPPAGFCFDILCSDTPIIDDKDSTEYNVDSRVNDFVKFVKEQSQYYTSPNILMTMGSDFNYQDAHVWYKNLDKLIKYTNEKNPDLNLFYSTPSCYLKAVNDANLKYSTKSDDFFPYASDPNSYWTGYFTSRPALKYYERKGNNFLQVIKQLISLSGFLGTSNELDSLKSAMGILQHHDAVAGTEKQAVADDYAYLLSKAISMNDGILQNAINTLLQKSTEAETMELNSCWLRNISKCEISEMEDSFVVTVYNPLSQNYNPYVRIPVSGNNYTVKDPEGNYINTQIIPIPEEVLNLKEREGSAAKNDLWFQATNLPPLGLKSYFIESAAGDAPGSSNADEIGNNKIKLKLTNGTPTSLTANGLTIDFSQGFYYYEGAIGNNEEFKNRSSGAYIFRPKNNETISLSDSPTSTVYLGEIVNEIHQKFNDWVSQVIRVFKDSDYIEFEWLIGPIPVDDKVGKEIVNKFVTNLDSEGIFFTDANAREVLERKRNFRPTWNLEVNEPVAGNYYPINSKIVIRDSNQKAEFAVLNDRSQGGSSLQDGEIELMVHRRLLHDDAFGVGEALSEEAFGEGLIVRGIHYVMLGSLEEEEIQMRAKERTMAQRISLSPWVFISPSKGKSFNQWQELYKMEFSGLKQQLPPNVQILTLEPWNDLSLLLRLEHIMEKNDDPELSKNVTVNINEIFSTLNILNSDETILGGNQLLSESSRLAWNTNEKEGKENKNDVDNDNFVNLFPTEIHTFLIQTKV